MQQDLTLEQLILGFVVAVVALFVVLFLTGDDDE